MKSSKMIVRDEYIQDSRSLLVKAAEFKNTKTGYEPPETLGKPKATTKEGKKVMAQDKAICNVLSGFQDELSYLAMPKFVGYSMLSNISQEALIRAGVETIADEMTRKLVEWTYDDDDGEDDGKKDKLITDMETQCAKYKIVDIFNDALCKDGLFGGCLIYIDVGDLDDEEKAEPLILDKKTFKKGSFRGLKVIEPINCYPGWYNSSDPTSPDYFKPKYWYIMGKKYHASRFIYIASNEAPLLLKPAYNFFGIPRAQLALDYVAQFVANRESAQELLNKFSLTCWKTNMAQVLQGASTSDLVKRAKLFNKMKHNSGVMLLDKETEDMVQLNTPLGGVREIVEMSLNLLTAVWRIPKIKYIGEGEGGLNASSVEQMRSFYDFILSQKQKVLTNPFEILMKIFQLNLGYDINEALGFRFPSLVEMDESDRANLNKMQADRDNIYLSAGVISQEEVRQRLSMDKNSGYSMIDVDEVPEMPEEPLKDDEKVETDEQDRIAADMAMDEEEPKDWITVKGTHVPIMEGESKKEVAKKFVEEKSDNDKSDEELENEYWELADKKNRNIEMTDIENKRLQDLWVETLYRRHVLRKKETTKDEKPTFIQKIKGFFGDGFKSSHQKDLVQDWFDSKGRKHNDKTNQFEDKYGTVKEWGEAFDFTQQPEKAIEKLLKEKRGYVPGAIYKKGIGLIDFVWGIPGEKGTEKGYGLSHIIRRRNEQGYNGVRFVRQIPSIIKYGTVYNPPDVRDRVYVESEDKQAVIRLDWNNQERQWLVTAYFKEKQNT